MTITQIQVEFKDDLNASFSAIAAFDGQTLTVELFDEQKQANHRVTGPKDTVYSWAVAFYKALNKHCSLINPGKFTLEFVKLTVKAFPQYYYCLKNIDLSDG